MGMPGGPTVLPFKAEKLRCVPQQCTLGISTDTQGKTKHTLMYLQLLASVQG